MFTAGGGRSAGWSPGGSARTRPSGPCSGSPTTARAVLIAIEREQAMTFVPRWFGFPAWLHGAAPGTFRALATRFS